MKNEIFAVIELLPAGLLARQFVDGCADLMSYCTVGFT
jgi:hypothetical protein